MSTPIVRIGPFRRPALVCRVVLLATLIGCDRGNRDAANPAFVPSWTEARQSLESSLSAWRDAPPESRATFELPGVQFVDKSRTPERKLLSFKILGQTEIENTRQFTVRLNLEGEEPPQLVKYNVLGRDPIWVFRLDDYESFAHWEHEMTEPGSTGQPKSAEQPAATK